MNAANGEWDVRCPDELKKLFPKRTGYYYKVERDTAGKVLKILSDAYGIPTPELGDIEKGSKEYAAYMYDTKTVLLNRRNHLKTVFHEFYHHLDNVTGGQYNSDDREGGSSSLAWIFADMLWAQFTNKNSLLFFDH